MGKAGDKATRIVEDSKKQAKTKAQHEAAKFKERLNKVAATDDGQYVLNKLMGMCGFALTSVHVREDGSVDTEAISYNEGRRAVWLDMRRYIDPRFLKKIEFMRGK